MPFGTPLFTAAARLRSSHAACFTLAICSFLVALALRFAAHPYLPPGFPYLTFFPAVLITAFLGGTLPGILCAILSLLAAWYWFIEPINTFTLDAQNIVAVLFFVFIVVADILIIHVMNGAVEQLRREKIYSDGLLEQQKTLFQELQHRTANNLAFISAVLSMHRRRASAHPEAVAAFDEASLRLDTMSQVHRRLYDPANLDRPLDAYFRDLVADVLQSSGREGIALDVHTGGERIDLQRLLTLSLIIIEVVTNSLKHAFADGRSGRITISLERSPSEPSYVLTVRDNGLGYPAEFNPAASKRLGIRILNNFAGSLGGRIEYSSDNGAVTRLIFPLENPIGSPR